MNNPKQRVVSRFKCWWFGCELDTEAYLQVNDIGCQRCGYECCDDDICGNTRYRRATYLLRYWFYRKWVPEKCWACGNRFQCDDSVDHIPF